MTNGKNISAKTKSRLTNGQINSSISKHTEDKPDTALYINSLNVEVSLILLK